MPPKRKLRTASDVLSRLRWEPRGDIVMMGYMDRIEGVLEKRIDDHVPASLGGDIPEHRILYFRSDTDAKGTEKQVLWDRIGRVDRIFNSGNGGSAPVSHETLQSVEEARANMKRLEEEKRLRRIRKAKKMSWRQIHSHQEGAFLQESRTSVTESILSTPTRFKWNSVHAFSYCFQSDDWVHYRPDRPISASTLSERGLVVMTWNVLFEIFDRGLEGEENPESNEVASIPRWRALCSELRNNDADVICLQEVTPDFLAVLCSETWVKEGYTCSSAPGFEKSIARSGVMILWKRSSLSLLQGFSLLECIDNGRNRSLVVPLVPVQCASTCIIFSVVHLPADRPPGESREVSRAIARKRELATVLGQCACIETSIRNSRIHDVSSLTAVIAGDFNSEDDFLFDGRFGAAPSKTALNSILLRDVWSETEASDGFTFDPITNVRAERSSRLVQGKERARRIDRVFVGPTVRMSPDNKPSSSICVRALGAKVVGRGSVDNLPPSDHYGVCASLKLQQSASFKNPQVQYRSNWAMNSPISANFMLALVLESPNLESLKAEHDPLSSYPTLHLTLLHGFIEVDSGTKDILSNIIKHSLVSTNEKICPPATLGISNESFDVFEHRSSSTIVAIPSHCPWLHLLYSELRKIFIDCDEQERHSRKGWYPHVTLGAADSSSRAREVISSWIEKHNCGSESMRLVAVDVLQRGQDNKFSSIASIPIYPTHLQNAVSTKKFVSDCGLYLSTVMQQLSYIAIARVNRACRLVARCHSGHVSVHIKGSVQLGTALPHLSDIDAIAVVSWSMSDVDFLRQVQQQLQKEVPCSKSRLRPAGRMCILTVRIPDLPSLDLTVVPQNGQPINENDVILSTLAESGGKALISCFQGALRILKVWAYKRDIYGSMSGFLSGSALAIWVARCAMDVHPKSSEELVGRFFAWAVAFEGHPYVSLVSSGDNCFDLEHAGVLTITLHSESDANNFSSKATASTTRAIFQELRDASTYLSHLKPFDLETFLGDSKRSTQQFIFAFSHSISIKIKSVLPTDLTPADIKAHGHKEVLSLMVQLEKSSVSANSILLRPKAQCIRLPSKNVTDLDESTFVYMIGVGTSSSHPSLLKAIQEFIKDWNEERSHNKEEVESVVELFTSKDLSKLCTRPT